MHFFLSSPRNYKGVKAEAWSYANYRWFFIKQQFQVCFLKELHLLLHFLHQDRGGQPAGKQKEQRWPEAN